MSGLPLSPFYLLFGAGILSCALPSTAGQVPIEGNVTERSALSGEWSGSYWSHGVRRRGIISFSLAERADSGRGEVEITFSPALSSARTSGTVDPKGVDVTEADPKPCTIIDLKVVKVEDGHVQGATVPFWDPDCNCRARTEFEGTLAEGHITGTFTTRREATQNRLLTGHWRADRKAS
jgi:hypothetical protein